jgi:hypothetical protein
MHGDGRIDEIAAQRSQPSQGPLLVGTSKPAVSRHIRRENGCEFPGLRQDSTLDVSQSSTISWFERELTGGLKKAPHFQSASDRPVTEA